MVLVLIGRAPRPIPAQTLDHLTVLGDAGDNYRPPCSDRQGSEDLGKGGFG